MPCRLLYLFVVLACVRPCCGLCLVPDSVIAAACGLLRYFDLCSGLLSLAQGFFDTLRMEVSDRSEIVSVSF